MAKQIDIVNLVKKAQMSHQECEQVIKICQEKIQAQFIYPDEPLVYDLDFNTIETLSNNEEYDTPKYWLCSYLSEWFLEQDFVKNPNPIHFKNYMVNGELWDFTLLATKTERGEGWQSIDEWHVKEIKIINKVKHQKESQNGIKPSIC
jgi:hypothetical protein